MTQRDIFTMILLIVNSEHSDISICVPGCVYVEKYTWALQNIIVVTMNLEEKIM